MTANITCFKFFNFIWQSVRINYETSNLKLHVIVYALCLSVNWNMGRGVYSSMTFDSIPPPLLGFAYLPHKIIPS